jgi:hypothetical protein
LKNSTRQFQCVIMMAKVLFTLTSLQNLDICDGRGFVFYITPLQNLDVLNSLKKTIKIICCNVVYQCINNQCMLKVVYQCINNQCMLKVMFQCINNQCMLKLMFQNEKLCLLGLLE